MLTSSLTFGQLSADLEKLMNPPKPYRATLISREGTPHNFTVRSRRADGSEVTLQRMCSDDRYAARFE